MQLDDVRAQLSARIPIPRFRTAEPDVSEPWTLLLTDIVDSTQLNDTLGDAVMAPIWEAHDRNARDLIRAWRGKEIARSDGFLVLFGEPRDAAGFATAYHLALRAIDTRLKARVGLHVGPVLLRENSEADQQSGAPRYEVDGLALPTVARVMAAALGGQTLLTGPAVQALGTSLSARLRSHGHWRMKGVSGPMELFEIGDADTLFQPPPDSAKAYRVVRSPNEWVPAREIANNLPAERDAFIGRDDALQTLARLIDGATRLVTVVGIGGIGKTRLVLRHARTWLGDYPGGVWFCDLSTARGIDGIVYAVAQALDVPLGKADPVRQIASAIAARGPCLVILDTFEQVARHAEATLGVWLAHAGEARFIVSSREVLGIAGEQTQVLAPMADDESVRLFMGRAAAATNQLSMSKAEEVAVRPLVRLLDGLPLAIELAAARSRVMSPTMLLDRMKERFTLLAARGGRLDRQVTLRAALDWSWDLLLAEERAALAQLSVFEGGFTLEAAEAVLVAAPNGRGLLPLDLVQSLVDKSFVRQIGEDRFSLLQSVQDYASQHLRSDGRFDGSGPSAGLAAEVRHAIYFGGLSEDEVTAPGSMDLDNLVTACRRSVPRGDCTSASRTLALAWAVLELRGPFMLGADLSSLVLGMPGLPSSLVAGVNLVRGRASRALGRIGEARMGFEIALNAARDMRDRRCEAEALCKLGYLSVNAGRMEEAGIHLRTGLDLARAIGDKTLECDLLNGLGTLHDYMGRIDIALGDYERALAVARQFGNRRWEGGVLGNLGNVYYSQGRIAEAHQAYDAAFTIARELGHRQWEGNMLSNLGLLWQVEGDAEEARRTLGRSLQVAREIGHARLEVIVLCNLGIVEAGSGDLEAGRRNYESALLIAERLGDDRSQGQTLGYLGLLRTRQGGVEDGRRHLKRGHDLLQSLADEANLAILLCNSALAHLLCDDHLAAEEDLRRAQEIVRAMGVSTFDVDNALEQVKTALKSSTPNP